MCKTTSRAESISDDAVRKAAESAISYAEMIRILGLNEFSYSSACRVIKVLLERSETKFSPNCKAIRKQRSLEKAVKKTCPVCEQEFVTYKFGGQRIKTTCSYACANTFFRSGEQNGAFKPNRVKNHQEICFKYHKYECVICGENLIVSVHHYNHDHDDNRPENLVPLCQTHHQYVHSRYRYLVEGKIDTYVKMFLESNHTEVE
jgi:hypothetical protein